jgi:hypothetical protein
VFGTLPGERRWGTVLLLDGNVGIGGDPERLLRRVARLLTPGGRALVETEPPATRTRAVRARLETGSGAGAWFGWAVVGADAVGPLGAAAGLRHVETFVAGGRWFAELRCA